MSEPTKQISINVRDQHNIAHIVELAVAEREETGTVSILTAAGRVTQQRALTCLKRSENGTRLTCRASGADAVLSLKHDRNPPELHVSVSLLFMSFDAVYCLDRPEYDQLIDWIQHLSITFIDGAAGSS